MSRQIKLYILLALLGFVITTPAMADGWIFGAKTGTLVVDNSSVKTDPTNVGFMVGYEQGLVLGDLALEAEITKTMNKGEIKNSGKKFDANTQALYLAFRSAGPMYLTAKAGYMQVDNNDWKTKSGSSYGVGLGFSLAVVQLELEVAKAALDPDVTYINVGVVF